MRQVCAAFITSVLLISSAAAQGVVCEPNVWHVLSDEQLAERQIAGRAAFFQEAVDRAHTDRSKQEIIVVVTDCPVYGSGIRTIKSAPGVYSALFQIPEAFTIYLTVAYLRNRLEFDDLARDARKQVCFVRTNVLNMFDRDREPNEGPAVRRCMLEEAVTAGDGVYATWLARQSDLPVPRVASTSTAEQTQQHNEVIQGIKNSSE